jgi:hypothetical protein
MKNFEKNISLFRKVLSAKLGDKLTNKIEKEVREEYESLLPHIPFIGGDKNRLTKNLIDTTIALAFSKVMKRYNYSTEEIAVFLFEIMKETFNSIPKVKKFLIRSLMFLLLTFPFNILHQKIIKRFAKKSQLGIYSDNFVLYFIEGDGIEFDFGIDYTACPISKFWREQGAEEILPYICLYDYYSSEMKGTGLVRTITLAEGFEKCDFRFKRGRKPQNKQGTQVITRETLNK